MKDKNSKKKGSDKNSKKKGSDKNSKKKGSEKKSETKSLTSCALNISTSDQLTVIHLLGSYDLEVVKKALETISGYCNTNVPIINSFCDRGIWNSLYKLLDLKDVPILYLTLEIIHKILTLSNFKLILFDEIKSVFTKLMNIYLNIDDIDVLILTSSIMLKLLISPEIIEAVYEKLLINRALGVIKNKNNDDLRLNSITLITILITEKEHSKNVIQLPNYQINLYICFIKDTNPVLLKPSIDFLIKISSFQVPEVLVSLYNNNVPHLLINMLEEKYQHLYFDILYLCTLILDREENCIRFVETEEFPRLLSFVKQCTEPYELCYIKLLKIFAKFPDKDYRQKLHTYAFESVIMLFLDTKNIAVITEICLIFEMLSDHGFGLDYLICPQTIDKFISWLKMDKVPEEIVENVLNTLHCFLRKNRRTLHLFQNRLGFSVIEELFLNGQHIYKEEVFEKVLDIMKLYLTHPKYKDSMMNKEIYLKLLQIYDKSSDEFAIKSCYILNNHLETNCRNTFTEVNGCQILMDKLATTQNQQLFNNTLILIKTLIIYKKVAHVFLMNGLIPFLKNYENDFLCAKHIINMLCELFLPLKFHNNNRLEISDSIKDNFYLINGPWSGSFPLPEELEILKLCPRTTIYIVDFSYTKGIKEKLKNLEDREQEIELDSTSAVTLNRCDKPPVAQINFGGLTADPYLYDYFQELEQKLVDIDTKDSYKVIAKYVADQMSGFCDMSHLKPTHIFSIHLNHLRQRLGTNMIPIGFLRMGYSCERALLFKVLADRFDIYSALCRNSKIYWNEIALVCEEEDGIGPGVIYYVVDLFNDVGEIYAMENRKAIDYLDDLEKMI